MMFRNLWVTGVAFSCWSACGPSNDATPVVGVDRSAEMAAERWDATGTMPGSSMTSNPSSGGDQMSSSTTGAGPAHMVATAFDAIMKRRIECGRRPRSCDVDTLAVVGSPLHDRLSELMDERRVAGITASRRGSVRHRIDDVEVENEARARITTCLTDDTVLMSAGAIFDEGLFSAVTVWTMERVDDRWLWVDDDLVRWSRKEDLCGFAT